MTHRAVDLAEYAAHLTPAHLEAAQRHLLTKAISEFAHEHLVTPVALGLDTVAAHPARPPRPSSVEEGAQRLSRDPRPYALTSPGGESTYTFTARVLDLEHWVVDADSLTRTVGGTAAPLDVLAFVTEFADRLGLPGTLLPTYLEELSSTLAAAAWKRHHPGPPRTSWSTPTTRP